MNLPGVFHTKISIRGFTLTEMLLVLALIALVSVFAIPVGFSFYTAQTLDQIAEGLRSGLRTAHTAAALDTHESAHGVRILPTAFVMFTGDSYARRVQEDDDVIAIPGNVSVSGPDEIVFSRLAGEPTATGTFSIAAGNRKVEVRVNDSGLVE